MTKDTEEFSQFTPPVACRVYTLPREENLSGRKGWIQGNTEIGSVLEVTTCCLQGKYGVEIRNESVNKDNCVVANPPFHPSPRHCPFLLYLLTEQCESVRMKAWVMRNSQANAYHLLMHRHMAYKMHWRSERK